MTATPDLMVPTGLKLADIHPRRGIQFSPRLHSYLSLRRGLMLQFARLYNASVGEQWLGFIDDTHSFIGSQIWQILGQGRKACYGSFSGHQLEPLIEVPNFWENYLKIGRCAIDTKHEHYFVDDTRWDVQGETRHCLWCKNFSQKLEHYEKVTQHTRWVQIP